MGDERDSVCSFCGVVNRRKRLVKCDTCGCLFLLSCVGLTRAQAEAFGRWNCEQCRGVARVPARAETPPIDLVGYIGRCHHSLRVLNRIPKGAVIPVADALQRLIREALDRGCEIAWGRLLSFSYWGLGCPGESGGVRQVSLSTLVRQQVARFMEGTDLPAVKNTTRRRDGVRGGDETLKRRVAAKFAEGDVSGAVRELASAEGLAPQDRDTLRALKEKHPSAPENLSLPDPPDGSVVPAVATEEGNHVFSCWSFEWARWHPPWPPSIVGGPWFGGGRVAPSIHFNRPGERYAERRSSTVCCSRTLRSE